MEGTPAFGKALPFAGRCRNEGLGRVTRTAGTSSSLFDDSMTVRGARVSSHEEGNLRLALACGSSRHDGKLLRSGLLGPFNPASSPNGHRRKRWSDRGVARKQRRDRMMVFGVTFCRVLAARQDWLRRGCNGSQRSRNLLRQGKATRSVRRLALKSALKSAVESESTFSVAKKKGR